MRSLLFVVGLLFLSGCKITKGGGLVVATLGPKLSSSGPVDLPVVEPERLLVELEAARTSLVASIRRFRRDGDTLSSLCAPRYCGDDAASCAATNVLQVDGDKARYAKETLLTAAKLDAVAGALETATIVPTVKASDVTQEGEIFDSAIRGKEILVYRPRVAEGLKSTHLALLARQGFFLAGESGTGRAGPFGENSDAIQASSACLVSMARAFGGETPTSKAPAFAKNGAPVWSDLTGLKLANFRMRVRGALRDFNFVFRSADSFVEYQVALRSSTLSLISRGKVIGAWTHPPSAIVQRELDLVVEKVGSKFRVFFNGYPSIEETDPGGPVPDSGTTAAFFNFTAPPVTSFTVEDLTP